MNIYTDGACKTSDKTGGWAFVVIKDEEKVYSEFNSEDDTTNNRMEIMACIKALEYCLENNIKEIIINSDSMYVIGTMTLNWKRKKNTDLWQQMDSTIGGLNITWKHVKGHNGNKYNELCDTLAVHGSHLILNT